jgi:hypothetical protein
MRKMEEPPCHLRVAPTGKKRFRQEVLNGLTQYGKDENEKEAFYINTRLEALPICRAHPPKDHAAMSANIGTWQKVQNPATISDAGLPKSRRAVHKQLSCYIQNDVVPVAPYLGAVHALNQIHARVQGK